MYVKLSERNEYRLTYIHKQHLGGFECSLEFPDCTHWNYEYSDITKKFYPEGHKKKLPKYIQEAILQYAKDRGGYKL